MQIIYRNPLHIANGDVRIYSMPTVCPLASGNLRGIGTGGGLSRDFTHLRSVLSQYKKDLCYETKRGML